MSWITAILQLYSQVTDLFGNVIVKRINIRLFDLLARFHYIMNLPRIFSSKEKIDACQNTNSIGLNYLYLYKHSFYKIKLSRFEDLNGSQCLTEIFKQFISTSFYISCTHSKSYNVDETDNINILFDKE